MDGIGMEITVSAKRPDPWPTVIAAALAGWNLAHYKNGPHVSGFLSKHPVLTTALLAYYAMHFNQERIQRVVHQRTGVVDGSASGPPRPWHRVRRQPVG